MPPEALNLENLKDWQNSGGENQSMDLPLDSSVDVRFWQKFLVYR
jgi:hypothetical protein